MAFANNLSELRLVNEFLPSPVEPVTKAGQRSSFVQAPLVCTKTRGKADGYQEIIADPLFAFYASVTTASHLTQFMRFGPAPAFAQDDQREDKDDQCEDDNGQ
ncbi:MAG: hypothetical protein J2P48_11435 [Alphaproteobacteria bacterium]|nr:hypothetical protein [Alphaproteobacteria bacterium]